MRRTLAVPALVLALAGCDAVFGLGEPSAGDGGPRDGSADDGGAVGDAFLDPVLPACWGMYQDIGTLPAARYALSQQSYTCADAQILCQNVGAHLLVVSHADSEQVQVFGAFLSSFWAGLTDATTEGTWTSVTGEPVLVASSRPTKTAWADGEPGLTSVTADCARNIVNLGANLGLFDDACGTPDHALCECELPVSCPLNPGSYAVAVEVGSWDAARAVCAAKGRQLAAFGSADALQAAQVVLAGTPGVVGVWIDARDTVTERDWRAASGCRPYLRWAMTTTPEPGGGTSENCAQLTAKGVSDAPCATVLPALCQDP